MDEEVSKDLRILAKAIELRLGRKPTAAEMVDFVMTPKSVRKMFFEMPHRTAVKP